MKTKNLWFEEYKTCSCSFISKKLKDLLGYCPKHGTDRKYKIKMQDCGIISDNELGYVET